MDIVIAVIVSAVIGFAMAAFLFRPEEQDNKKLSELESQLRNKEEELEKYRSNVNEHFNKTADMFTQMTDQYRNLYAFMAEQSQNLCDNPIQMQLTNDHNKIDNDTNTNDRSDLEEPDTNASQGAEVIELRTEKEKQQANAPKDYVENES